MRALSHFLHAKIDDENVKIVEYNTGDTLQDFIVQPASKLLISTKKPWKNISKTKGNIVSFAQKYHSLSQSPFGGLLEALLELEKAYSNSVAELCDTRTTVLLQMRRRHADWSSVEQAASETEMVQSMLSAAFEDVYQQQRKSYREFIELLYQQHLNLLSSLGFHDNSDAGAASAKKEVAQLVSNDPDIGKRMVQDVLERHRVETYIPPLDLSFLADPNSAVVQMESLDDLFGEFQETKLESRENSLVSSLLDMGFSMDMSQAALKMTGNSLENAISLLLEQPDSVEAWINSTQFSAAPKPKPAKPSSLASWKASIASSSAAALGSAGQKRQRPVVVAPTAPSRNVTPTPKSSPSKPSSSKPSPSKQDPFGLKRLGDVLTQTLQPAQEAPVENAFSEPMHSEMWTVSMGSQVRSTYTIRLSSQTIPSLFKPPPDAKQDLACRAQTLGVLYESGLRGIVIVVSPMEWNKILNSVGCKRPVGTGGKPSPSVKALFDSCRRSTEFHFEKFEDQLRSIDAKFNQDYAKEGDVFVTKHSNLPLIHLVFFLISDTQELTNRSTSVSALRRIVKFAFEHDVCHVSLSLLLQPDLEESEMVDKRAEVVFKAIKGCLIESKGAKDARTLQFLVPADATGEWETLRDRCAEVFRTGD
jgi:hypothetical protein